MQYWQKLFDYSISAKSGNREDHRKIYLSNPNDSSTNILSPVTNLTLNILAKIFKSNENLIINFPKKILKPIPLIAYMFSEITSRSVLVFSAGNINNKQDLIRIHNDNFYSLSTVNKWGKEANIFENCSMGYLKNKNELSYKIILPKASTRYKKDLKKNLNKILEDKPKIVLMGNSALTTIKSTISKISIDNDDLKNEDIINNMNLDIGCIIFENADKYFSSKHSARYFVEWLNKNVDSNINIIFHFSNPNLSYLDEIKEVTKAKVISFNIAIIRNNDILRESSMEYYKNCDNLDIVGRYNLDDESDYYHNSKFILDDVKLEKGNLDYYIYNANKLKEFIKEDEIGSNSLYYHAQKLFLDLNNLTINPSFFKFRIAYNDSFSYVSVPHFIDLFKNSLQQESNNNKIYLKKYISFLSQFYDELSKKKRFYESKSYTIVGKDYRLCEIVENKEEYFGNDNDLIIGTFHNTEQGILSNQLNDFSNVEIKYLGNLIKEYSDSSNLNLLLPGFVPPRFMSELYKNYSKILILNHDGYNRENITWQINSIEKPSINDESRSMEYFLELYDNNDNAFTKNYKKRLEKEMDSKNIEIEVSETSDDNKTNNKINETENYRKYLDLFMNIEKKISSSQATNYLKSYSSNSNQFLSSKTVDLELELTNNRHIIKTVPAKKKYLYFKDYNALEDAFEIKAEDLSKGEYVIILDNDKISFTDLFIEIFKLEENIDRNLAEYWKDKISIFVDEKNLSYDEFYELYKKEGGQKKIPTIKNWLKGKNISPQDYKKDLTYLSKVMGDDFLLNNIEVMGEEFRKIKAMHIAMGKNLKTIMKGILLDDFSLDYDSLSLEEQTMHNIIKNSVYKVISVNK